MPRHANLGNGNLLVTLDKKGLMRDIYFPYVGMENQTAYKHFHRIGLFDKDEGKMSWLNEDDWQTKMKYDEDSLICLTTATNKNMGITLDFRDGVHTQENIFIRSISITNHWDKDREVKIFFNQDFHIYGDKLQDTALFAPEIKNPKKDGAMIHYRKRRYFLINGYSEDYGLEEFTTGKAHYRGLEGTWRDAEDGELSFHPIEQGSVDSTIGFKHSLPANGKSKQYYWLCTGKTHNEVEELNDIVIHAGADHLLNTTKTYWENWTNQKELGCVKLDDRIMNLMKRSLLIVRTACDNRGAIIAANDADIMAFNKDTYTYMWPRDGALISHALDSAGYLEVTRKFFNFCSRVISDEGYMLHKYNPDGSIGSSWHPWYKNGKPMLPIQEDETALIIYALDHHYKQFQDIEFIRPMYHKFIKPMSEFLYSFVNSNHLPKPSYDPWEEHFGVHTYTTATTIAGLKSAANIAELMGHPKKALRYKKRAQSMTDAMKNLLWNKKRQCFYKYMTVDENGKCESYNSTIDVSTMGVWLFGVLPANDELVLKNHQAIKENLWVNTEVGGIARYENDWYQRTEEGENIPGNPWILTTLWYAMWLTDNAEGAESPEMKEALELINWAADKATSTGILPEQLHFQTGEHLSVSPLTWSHATFVEAVLKYCHKLEELGVCNT